MAEVIRKLVTMGICRQNRDFFNCIDANRAALAVFDFESKSDPPTSVEQHLKKTHFRYGLSREYRI